MSKVYIENSNAQYDALFRSYGFEFVSDPLDADLVVFTGGSDVTPSFYGAAPHKYTMNDKSRDVRERALFDKMLWSEIPMVGICRGGQFLNVMSGGMMYQDVTNHTQSHMIRDLKTQENIYVSSTHHQMMYPGNNVEVVAVAYESSEREWFDNGTFYKDVADVDYEVLFYPNTRCLCFQPHPEFTSPDYATMKKYFRDSIKKYLKV